MRRKRTIRSIWVAAAAMPVLVVGCAEAEPVLLPVNDGAATIQAEVSVASGQVIDMRTTEPTAPGQVAGAQAATNPPLTSSSIATPAPPLSLTGADQTTPTTRPAADSTTSTSTPTTVAPASPSASNTATSTELVEFRIPAGTQGGPWNTFDNPVRVSIGQTLRIYNDDIVPHTTHSNGAPFEHGPTIQPGEFADHPIITALTPDPAAPANYEHDAGVTAPFWVVANQADRSDTGAAGQDELAAAEAESMRLLNELRTGLGVQTVTPSDAEMHTFARAWSLEMRRTGFRHSSPPRWFENIVWYSDDAMTPTEAAAQFHEMWVNSPGHYENMTNPDWSIVGVGMWHDESGWWGVHVFR